MESNTSQSQSRRSPGEAKESVVRRKAEAGKSGVGRGGVRLSKATGEEQNREVIQVNKVTGRGRKGDVENGRRSQPNTNKVLREPDLTIKVEKEGVGERKNGQTVERKKKNESTVRVAKEELKKRVEVKKGGGDGEIILQKAEEEKKIGELFKRGPGAAGKGTREENQVKKKLSRTGSKQSLGIEDYLTLLKLLKINLPKGALNLTVIKHSADPNVIQDAQNIIQDLEKFKLKFIANPRLGCREVKHALILKKRGNAQEISRIIFFENAKDSEETLKDAWTKNASNGGHGFRMRDRYRTTPISIPVMYATAKTRSWKRLEPGEDLAKITEGVRVNVQELEKMEYSDESSIQASSGPQRFGNFFRNPADEMECLKFFHEQKEITSKYDKLTYTKGNKVEFGFLTGNLDFLAEARHKTASAKSNKFSTPNKDKIIIECKGTTGDMVGKLFTKPHNGCRQAQFTETHEYWYQTQAYMYILKRVKQTATVRAVMVVRHYHSDSSRLRDFCWNYLREDHTKQIDELRVYCQEEVLARFLAVLGLIFQKETDPLEQIP
ncbi:uncharacterized protein LOC118820429 [Colossoma macropomum]|uniref:uncharacterized protein LOC118820429 n=1 Tax=Colossoma macropomum TaxID=42526 RepID=UPI00186432AC|nr:uncharacterized protein LOC118820429 [Colossoma macropomum]XP_036444679.1 uncharacterized protein LOC118820429 [Colossoma macropomum]